MGQKEATLCRRQSGGKKIFRGGGEQFPDLAEGRGGTRRSIRKVAEGLFTFCFSSRGHKKGGKKSLPWQGRVPPKKKGKEKALFVRKFQEERYLGLSCRTLSLQKKGGEEDIRERESYGGGGKGKLLLRDGALVNSVKEILILRLVLGRGEPPLQDSSSSGKTRGKIVTSSP